MLNELATVKGMNVGDYGFVDFSRIKPYIIDQWYNGYEKDCSEPARDYIRKNAIIVNKVAEIPATHEDGVVPGHETGLKDALAKWKIVKGKLDALA